MRNRFISRLQLAGMTFKQKLIVYSMLLSIVPVLILGTIASYMITSGIQDEVNRNHMIILKQLEAQMDSFMRSLDRASLALANDQIIQKSLVTGIRMDNVRPSLDMIDTILKSTGNSEVNFEVSLFYNRYNMIYSSQSGVMREISYPYPEIAQFIKLRYNGLTVIPPNAYPNMQEMMLIRTIPLNNPNPDGFLILHMDVNKINRFIDQLDLGGHRKVLIVDSDRKVITSRDYDDIGTELQQYDSLYQYWLNPGVFAGTIELGDTQYNVSSLKSTTNNWTYIAMTPAKELTSKSNRIRNLMWILVGCISLLWLTFGLVGSRRLYHPIHSMVLKIARAGKTQHDGLKAIDHFMDDMLADNEHLQSQLKQQKPRLKEFIFQQLLRGEIADADKQMLREADPPFVGPWFYVVVVEIDQYVSYRQMYKENDRLLLMYALRKMVEELAVHLPSHVAVSPKSGQVALMIGTEEAASGQTAGMVEPLGAEIRKHVKTYFQFTVSITRSNARPGYAGISESYQEALDLLDYRWVSGSDSYLTADMLEQPLQQSGRILVEWKSAIVGSVAKGDFDRARSELAEMMEAVPRPLQSPDTIKGLFALLIGELDQHIGDLGYQLQDMFEYDVIVHLYKLSSLEEVQSWMADTVLASIQTYLQTNSQSRRRKLIVRVQQYIVDHYDTDLSLQSLADRFELSPGSLSRMFKEECGHNYLDYVIGVRMDKAKEWLAHSDMTIKEMTDRLRYTTVHNFSRIFKQVTGMPPGSYRKLYRDHAQ